MITHSGSRVAGLRVLGGEVGKEKQEGLDRKLTRYSMRSSLLHWQSHHY